MILIESGINGVQPWKKFIYQLISKIATDPYGQVFDVYLWVFLFVS